VLNNTTSNKITMEQQRKAMSTADREKDKSALLKLFTDEVKDIYWAEKHLVKALPKMAKGATSDELTSAIEKHIGETEVHVQRLEDVFGILGIKPQAKKCNAMAGLIEEGEGILEDTEEGTMTRDAGIISAAQKVEHYEIATYGTLRVLANTLGLTDAAELLGTTLEEEKATDVGLTVIAEGFVNEAAAQEVE
jgi:ferritin-like metal-binding protein YciE